MCFLRFEGMTAEAQHLEETEFAEATAQARRHAGSDFEAEPILQQLITEERERVADAIAFAEVLVPMLASRFAHLAPHPASASAPAQRKAPSPVPSESRGIADFIDDMLTEDRRVSR